MDVRFTEEQEALRTGVRRMLEDTSPTDHVRRIGEGPSGLDEALYSRLLSMGAAELPGLIEFGIVMEECGRTLAPTAALSVLGRALPALDLAAAEDLAEQVRTGRCFPLLLDGWVTSPDLTTVSTSSAAVADAGIATHFLVPMRTADGRTGLGVVAAEDAVVEPRPSMDRTRRLSRVHLRDAPVQVVGADAFDEGALATTRCWALISTAHELIGVSAAVQALAVEHAKTREQFGRPIGYYQAVSHRCADMFIALERVRSLCYYAAWAVDAGAADAEVAAVQAKVAAGAAAVDAAQSSIQVHGGTGFTWEHDLHLYLKRAWWGQSVMGPADALLLEVGDRALDEAVR